MATWIKLGEVGVDSGLLSIMDPCYAVGSNSEINCESDGEWGDFLSLQRKNSNLLNHQVNYAMGHSGLAVLAGTAHGDGVYEVWGLKEDPTSDRCLAMIVVTGEHSELDFLEGGA